MDTEKKEMREREISLIDLFAEILLHWRGMLLSALLGAVLLGAFGYMRSMQSAKVQNRMLEEQRYAAEQQKEMSEEELENSWDPNRVLMESNLSETQLASVNTAIVYKERYEEKLNYQNNSPLMQLDPFHVQRTDLTFLIQTDDNNNACMIKNIYNDFLKSTSLFEYVQEQCNIAEGVDELIRLGTSGDGIIQQTSMTEDGERQSTNVNLQVIQERESNVLSVQIIHNDADTCQSMADAVVSYVRQQRQELVGIVGNHEVVLLNRSQGNVSDLDVAYLQKTCANDLYLMQNMLNVMTAGFSAEQLKYYNYMLQARQNSNEQDNSGGNATIWAPPGLSAKYIVLGAILFAFAYVAMIFIKYIFNNKIRSTDNFQGLYSIPQLGTVTVSDRKRFLGVIDRWILQLRYHNQRRFTPEESVNLAIVAVKMEAKKRNLKQIYLVGCNLSGTAGQVCDRIKTALGEEQIEVISLNNVLYDAEAMGKLENAEAAVLVETSGATLYDEIVQEMQLLIRQNIVILGGIVVE